MEAAAHRGAFTISPWFVTRIDTVVRKIPSPLRKPPGCKYPVKAHRGDMSTFPDGEPTSNDVPAANAGLSGEEGIEVMLHRFLGVLNGIEPQIARRMRDEISSRFGGRYCSDQMCAMMAELVNGYLAGGPVLARVRSSQ